MEQDQSKTETLAAVRSSDGLGIWCVAVACDLVTEAKGFWGSQKSESSLSQRMVTAGSAEVAKAIAVAEVLEWATAQRPDAKVTMRQCCTKRIKDA